MNITFQILHYKSPRNGDFTELPQLIENRESHGCGSYMNSNDEKVLILLIIEIICFLLKHLILRYSW